VLLVIIYFLFRYHYYGKIDSGEEQLYNGNVISDNFFQSHSHSDEISMPIRKSMVIRNKDSFLNPQTVRKKMRLMKDTMKGYQHKGVYKVECFWCKCYIGKTG
jgi:hypothetical protein